MVPYMFAVYEFSVSEKITILLFEQSILLKDISKPYKYGSSVKVNGISDGILRNFMW